MKNIFTDTDFAQMTAHGLVIEEVERQLDNFHTGFPYLNIEKPAVKGDGIFIPDGKSITYFTDEYRNGTDEKKIVKFVPASGAATRMFKDLFTFIDSGERNPSTENITGNIGNFAFYNIIKSKTDGMDCRAAAQAVLDYGANLPKGLIAFHKYQKGIRTAVEEHLVEGAQYAASNGEVSIHFTVSPEHEEGFRKLLDTVIPDYEKRFDLKYQITFSQQKPSTDTIAVMPNNEPFREKDGTLLFRPAGHGALIGNLSEIDADIVFIKNIDNVTTDRLRADTITYKRLIGGIMFSLQKKIFNYLRIIDQKAGDAMLEDIRKFIEVELLYTLPVSFASQNEEDKAAYMRRVLDRPLRVCAMVRNEGEPGGGPFWVNNADGSQSLQIGESSQVAPESKHLFKEATHFNPVDLVCGIKDYKGDKYDLTKYTDPSTGFISEKSKDGRPLKAQELPGLWNGAMANWNTVFVEVPVSTFTPVKELNDLLRPEHQ